uniref:Pre-mRNA-splicing factor SYF1 n=1 Tax=Parascaris equorum TaxID=6256 RepID=A0A914RVW2_PAREQ
MGMATPKSTTVVLEDEDVGFEENILRNPFSLRCWLRYVEHKKKCKAPLKQINMVYERALKELPGSYKLWYNYLRFRRKQVADKCPTDAAYQRLNNVYERALVFMHKVLTQHERIWPLYIKFVTGHAIPETTIRVYRRYLKLMPKYREDFVEYLHEIDRLDDAAQQLAILVNDDKLVSEHGKTTHQLWTELCELISKNPNKVHSLNVDSIIRQGIQSGGPMVRTRRILYSSGAFREEEVADEDQQLELELLFARFEHLMDRRPLLLNSVLLRQNPHNAHEWLNRVQLYEGNKVKQVETYEEAVRTVQPKLQTEPPYCKVDDLATVWCEYAEFELRNREPERARKLMRRATAAPPRRSHYFDDSEPVQYRVYKSLKVWSLYADIEEAFGTLESCQAVYERIIDLRIATPQIIINYAKFLEENEFFENSFKGNWY